MFIYAPYVVETHNEYLCSGRVSMKVTTQTVQLTFFGKEVHTTDRLLNLQALPELTCLDIPKPNSLVVRTTDEAFPYSNTSQMLT